MTQAANAKGKRAYGVGALVALAILFVGVTVFVNFVLRGARIDLTESKLYSIAPGTQRILESLEEPINLYFFFSQEASAHSPPIRAYAQRVRELLEEMTERSKGKLRLQVIDPKPFSEDEDRAGEFGLQAVPIGIRGETLYFGLAGTNSTDGRETIGFFQPDKEEFLEYDIASLIYRLAHPERPMVGVMSSLPVDAGFDPATGQLREGWASINQLRELFTIQTIATDVPSIPEEVAILMVIHPRNLPESTLYAIDQFVMRGGKLIAFVDPQSEIDPSSQQMGGMSSRSSTLGKLFDAWGIEYDDTKFVGDRELGLTVSLRQGEPASLHVQIIGFNRSSMNKQDVVTSALDTINTWTVGALKKKDGAEIQFEPLIQSSANAMLMPTSRLAFPQDSRALLEGFQPSGERYAMAARITGKLKSAFPDGAPNSKESSEDKSSAKAHLAESKGDANLIVVADTDLLADPLWIRTQNVFGQRVAIAWANNGDFVSNSLDNLTGSADLISIRGRQSFFRPFTRVDALRQQADDRLRAKEQELDKELRETERKLSELQASRDDQGSLLLSPEQEAELRRFQQERVRIRKELRDVRRSLDVEIERLGTALKFWNIFFIPILIAIGAAALAVVRRNRLKAGRAVAQSG
jgi:ABC-type uncharacterized transport system involved in gliding motility auxiliary subunit